MEKIKPIKMSVKNHDKSFGFSRLELNLKGEIILVKKELKTL